MIKSFLTAAALMASFSAVSLAANQPATLSGISGKVLVNNGKGFHAVTQSAPVEAGDQVFVAEGSSAVVHFNDANCDVVLAAANVTRISGADMCQQAFAEPTTASGLRGSTDDVVITATNGGVYVPPPPPPGFLSPLLIAGGITAISAVALADSMTQKDTPAPVSGP